MSAKCPKGGIDATYTHCESYTSRLTDFGSQVTQLTYRIWRQASDHLAQEEANTLAKEDVRTLITALNLTVEHALRITKGQDAYSQTTRNQCIRLAQSISRETTLLERDLECTSNS
jgi:uncharacterized protein (DUF1778 family)